MLQKTIPFLLLGILLVMSPRLLSSAPHPMPTSKDMLLMRHTVLTLWQMGFTAPPSMNTHELCGTTLRFLIRNQFHDSAELREDYPERFTNIPENYTLFFDRDLVENTARNVFNGWIDQNALWPGVFLGAAGYYVDTDALHEGIYTNDESFLPSYVSIDSMQRQTDGTVIMSGKCRRFRKHGSSGEEIIWASVLFMASFVQEDGKWRIVSFVFTEEAMG